MTPNLMKGQTDTSKFMDHPNNPNNNDSTNPQAGAQATSAGGKDTSIFSKDGAIGKQFTTEGAIGGTAQSIGGPLDKDGIIGRQFDAEKGSIGGTAQKMAEGNANQMNHGGSG